MIQAHVQQENAISLKAFLKQPGFQKRYIFTLSIMCPKDVCLMIFKRYYLVVIAVRLMES